MLHDERFMDRAIALAEGGRGVVDPNPLVGAVVVAAARVVGEGFHARFGEPHAEVGALAEAGEAAAGATLYVSLEPCCHHGKTPPCTDAIVAAGIRRVVAPFADPDSRVSGRGFALLRERGIEVEVGVGADRAFVQNLPFIKRSLTGRPYVLAKWAMTLDGRIATVTGDSQWISTEASRAEVHRLRAWIGGVAIGIGTALADDPRLTCRAAGGRNPARFVLDSSARLPLDSQLVHSVTDAPLTVAHTSKAADYSRRALEDRGIRCLQVGGRDERVDIGLFLDAVGAEGITSLLVEGGSELLQSFFFAGQVDEVLVFVSPRLVGGQRAPGPLGGGGVGRLAEAYGPVRDLAAAVNEGGDVRIRGSLWDPELRRRMFGSREVRTVAST